MDTPKHRVPPEHWPLFGLRLRQARRLQQSLTQAELAQRSGYDQRNITAWERAVKCPPAMVGLRRLAQALGVTPQWLFDLPSEEALMYTIYGHVDYGDEEDTGGTPDERIRQTVMGLAPSYQYDEPTGVFWVGQGQAQVIVCSIRPGSREQQLRYLRVRAWDAAVRRARGALGGRVVLVVLAADARGRYTVPHPGAVDAVAAEARLFGMQLYGASSPDHVVSLLKFFDETPA